MNTSLQVLLYVVLITNALAVNATQNSPAAIELKPASSSAMPSAFREMVDRRLANLRTAHVESRWQIFESTGARIAYYTHKYAPGALLQVFQGNESGLISSSSAGQPYSYSPLYILRDNKGHEWHYIDGSLTAKVVDESSDFTGTIYDFRVWGLHPLATGPTNYSKRDGHLDPHVIVDAVYTAPVDKTDEQMLSDDLKRITIYFIGGAKAQYDLSLKEDLSPHQIIVLSDDGSEAYSVTSSFRQYSGRWFPSHMEFRRSGKAWITIDTILASFNDRTLQTSLEPGSDLGLLVGTNLMVKTRNGVQPCVWDGKGIATQEEYTALMQNGSIDNIQIAERVREYELEPPGRFPPAASRVLLSPSGGVNAAPHLWERYTRDFIFLYDLAPDQASSAWNIWRECFEDAGKYLSAHQREIDALQLRETSKSGAGDSSVVKGKGAAGLANAASRLDDLLTPVVKLFDDRLKPRLNALLTQEQLAKGERERRRLEAQMHSSIRAED